MFRPTLMALSMAALLSACIVRKVELREVEKLANDLWRSCIAVEVKNVKIEYQDRKIVRYSYILRMRGDGTLTGKNIPCPMPSQKMAEVFFNKDMVELKAGDEATVTQEAARQ